MNLPEFLHLGYPKKRGWKQWNIIKSGKELSVLTEDKDKVTQVTYYDDHAKKIIDFLEVTMEEL